MIEIESKATHLLADASDSIQMNSQFYSITKKMDKWKITVLAYLENQILIACNHPRDQLENPEEPCKL